MQYKFISHSRKVNQETRESGKRRVILHEVIHELKLADVQPPSTGGSQGCPRH